jgi:tetratricopeptide (TPR) repeat protein
MDGVLLDEVDALIDRASQESDWSVYEREFRDLLQRRPKDGMLYYALARVQFDKHKLAEAEELLELSLQYAAGSTWVAASTLHGVIQMQQGKLEEAETIMQRTLDGAARAGLLDDFGEMLSAHLLQLRTELLAQGNRGSIKSILRSQILDSTQVSECLHALGLIKDLEFTLRPGIIGYFAAHWGHRQEDSDGSSQHASEHAGTSRSSHGFIAGLLRVGLRGVGRALHRSFRFAFRTVLRSMLALVVIGAATFWAVNFAWGHTGDIREAILLTVAALLAWPVVRLLYLCVLGRSVRYTFHDANIVITSGVLWAEVLLVELIYTSGYEVDRSVMQRLLGCATLSFLVKDSGMNSISVRRVPLYLRKNIHDVEKLMMDLRGLNRVLHSIARIKNVVG